MELAGLRTDDDDGGTRCDVSRSIQFTFERSCKARTLFTIRTPAVKLFLDFAS